MNRETEEELMEILGQGLEQLSEASDGQGPFLSQWSHRRTGDIYLVTDVTLRETDLCPMVTYHQCGKSRIRWTRELANFVDKFQAAPDKECPDKWPTGFISSLNCKCGAQQMVRIASNQLRCSACQNVVRLVRVDF